MTDDRHVLTNAEAYTAAAIGKLGEVDHSQYLEHQIAVAQVWAILALAESIREANVPR